MSKTSQKKKSLKLPARDRIINVAAKLFYEQGYRATGINEVIEKSEVAKATFYNHFPTKDDLCQECLVLLRDNELRFIDESINNANGTVNRFLAVIKSLEPWATDTKFRGCGFINIASEIPDSKDPLRKEGIYLYNEIRKRVEILTKELFVFNKQKYSEKDVKNLSDEYMIAFAGAVAFIGIYHSIWPIQHAEQTIRDLIGK